MTFRTQYTMLAFAAVMLPTTALLLSGCNATGGPDLSPIGNGLGVLGISVVLAAFVLVLGSQWNKPKE